MTELPDDLPGEDLQDNPFPQLQPGSLGVRYIGPEEAARTFPAPDDAERARYEAIEDEDRERSLRMSALNFAIGFSHQAESASSADVVADARVFLAFLSGETDSPKAN
jgi:hypothetical protein